MTDSIPNLAGTVIEHIRPTLEEQPPLVQASVLAALTSRFLVNHVIGSDPVETDLMRRDVMLALIDAVQNLVDTDINNLRDANVAGHA